MLIWRACKDIIPTLINLKKRKIIEDSAYPICFRMPKTVCHILWECESAKDLWGQGCKKIQKLHMTSDSFLDIWLKLTNSCANAC